MRLIDVSQLSGNSFFWRFSHIAKVASIRLTVEQQQLVLDNLPFARWYARMFSTRAEREEARGICVCAMVEAAQTWTADGGAKFHSYASVFMRRRLIDDYRNKRRAIGQLIERPDEVAIAANAARREKLMAWLSTTGYEETESRLDEDILRAYLEHHSMKYVARKHNFAHAGGVLRYRRRLFCKLRLRAIADGLM